MGRQLIPRLLQRGHEVRALVRPGSEGKLPLGCTSVIGDALIRETFAEKIAPADTFVQLVGVSHPSPAKAAQFRSIDLVAGKASIEAAASADIRHFVYLSVAQPAPVMKAYIAVRAECEQMIRQRGLNASILRPWYVLGPGHRWPYGLIPIYWALEQLALIPRRRAATGSCVAGPDDRSAGSCGGVAGIRDTCDWCTGDSCRCETLVMFQQSLF
jgi:uncharacterized protein YbjT (DUF2867 family)